MKYKIGKIAKMLDVSVETVRNYERMGLVAPKRDQDSDYRYYDAIDLNILRRARAYTGYYNLSLKQSADLVIGGNVEDMAEALAVSERELRAHMRLENMLLMMTRDRQQRLKRLSMQENQYLLEYSPALYAFNYRHGQKFSESPKVQRLLQEWNKLRPFTEAFVVWEKETFDAEKSRRFYGLMIEEEYADFFSIQAEADITYYPARKCLYVFTSVPMEADLMDGSIFRTSVTHEMQKRGLTMAGDPFCRVLHSSKAAGKYRHYMDVWIPIE